MSIELDPEIEIHLLESLEKSSLEQSIEVYTEPEKIEGRKIQDNCEKRENCVRYLLDEDGLALREKKVSNEIASKLLANYCCSGCQACDR